MKSKQLTHISKIIAGQSPPSSTYNYTGEGLPFFQGKTDFQEKYPTARMWCTSEHRKESYPGDILISVRAPVGAVNICNQKSIIGRGLAAIRPNADTYGLYLYYYLKANEKQIDALGTGSTFKAITQETLKKIEIPTPDFDNQKRIAHLLSIVDGLISERKRHLQQLDALLQSVFLEMFGDPVRNEKGWKPVTVEDLSIEIVDCPHSTPEYCTERTGFLCVRSSDIANGYLLFERTYQVSESTYQERIKRHTPRRGDIIYSREGGRLGNAARVLSNDNICLGQRMMLFRTKSDIQSDFLWALLETPSFKNRVQSLVGGGAAPRVNIKDLKAIATINPNTDLKLSFSKVVKKIDKLKAYYQHSLGQLENLYGVLSQKAFKGELDLSQVPMPVEVVESISYDNTSQAQKIDLEAIANLGYTAAQYVHKVAQAIVPLLAPLVAAIYGFQAGLRDAQSTPLVPQPALELSVYGELPTVSESKARGATEAKRELHAIFTTFVKELGSIPFSTQDFLDALSQELEDAIEDAEQVPRITPLLYEEVKSWIFDSLATGTLQQAFDDEKGNAVYLRAGGQL